MRYALKIAYDGTDFSGWQRQTNARSVQEVLETILSERIGIAVKLTASGRTDAGVHAEGQVCHFDAEGLTLPPDKFPEAFNKFLPPDVKIQKSTASSSDFDANRTAKKKTYRYRVYLSKHEHPLLERYAVRIDERDTEGLAKIGKLFEGEHDFKAFCASGSCVKTTVRTVYSVDVKIGETFGIKTVDFFVTGNGFLYNMVRGIVGEILDIDEGKKDKGSLQKAFETGNRTLIGKTMPARGLTLVEVDYGEKLVW